MRTAITWMNSKLSLLQTSESFESTFKLECRFSHLFSDEIVASHHFCTFLLILIFGQCPHWELMIPYTHMYTFKAALKWRLATCMQSDLHPLPTAVTWHQPNGVQFHARLNFPGNQNFLFHYYLPMTGSHHYKAGSLVIGSRLNKSAHVADFFHHAAFYGQHVLALPHCVHPMTPVQAESKRHLDQTSKPKEQQSDMG